MGGSRNTSFSAASHLSRGSITPIVKRSDSSVGILSSEIEVNRRNSRGRSLSTGGRPRGASYSSGSVKESNISTKTYERSKTNNNSTHSSRGRSPGKRGFVSNTNRGISNGFNISDFSVPLTYIPKKTQVCVIGAGPAGLISAITLKEQGIHDVVLLEKSSFPSGINKHTETLNPSCLNTLDMIGLLEDIDLQEFSKKSKFVFNHHGREEEVIFDYDSLKEFGSSAFDSKHYTYNVDRFWFDFLLIRKAVNIGVKVFFGARVVQINSNSSKTQNASKISRRTGRRPSISSITSNGSNEGEYPVSLNWQSSKEENYEDEFANIEEGDISGELEFDFLIDASGENSVFAYQYLQKDEDEKAIETLQELSRVHLQCYFSKVKVNSKNRDTHFLSSTDLGWISTFPVKKVNKNDRKKLLSKTPISENSLPKRIKRSTSLGQINTLKLKNSDSFKKKNKMFGIFTKKSKKRKKEKESATNSFSDELCMELYHVGLSIDRETWNNFKTKNLSDKKILEQVIKSAPEIKQLLKRGVLSKHHPISKSRPHSFKLKKVVGNNWFIVGESAGAVDPFLGTGLQSAMQSAIIAAVSVASILRGDIDNNNAEQFYQEVHNLMFNRALFVQMALRSISAPDYTSILRKIYNSLMHFSGTIEQKQELTEAFEGVIKMGSGSLLHSFNVLSGGSPFSKDRITKSGMYIKRPNLSDRDDSMARLSFSSEISGLRLAFGKDENKRVTLKSLRRQTSTHHLRKPSYIPLTKSVPQSIQILIIGAGISGILTAISLRKLGIEHLVVLDDKELNRNSSSVLPDRSSSDRNELFLLNPSAQIVLDEIGVLETVKSKCSVIVRESFDIYWGVTRYRTEMNYKDGIGYFSNSHALFPLLGENNISETPKPPKRKKKNKEDAIDNTKKLLYVKRSILEKCLIEYATSLGIGVFTYIHVAKLFFDADRPVRARWVGGYDKMRTSEITFDILVDASGADRLLTKAHLSQSLNKIGLKNINYVSISTVYSIKSGLNLDLSIPELHMVVETTDGYLTFAPLSNEKDDSMFGNSSFSVVLIIPEGTFRGLTSGFEAMKPEEILTSAIDSSSKVSSLLNYCVTHGKEKSSGSSVDVVYHDCGTSKNSAGEGYFLVGEASSHVLPFFGTAEYSAIYSSILASSSISSLLRGSVKGSDIIEFYDSCVKGLFRNVLFGQYSFLTAQERVLSSSGKSSSIRGNDSSKELTMIGEQILTYSPSEHAKYLYSFFLDIIQSPGKTSEYFPLFMQLLDFASPFSVDSYSQNGMYIDFHPLRMLKYTPDISHLEHIKLLSDEGIQFDTKSKSKKTHTKNKKNNNVPSSSYVVVIGGGIAGLVSAISMVNQGISNVVVLAENEIDSTEVEFLSATSLMLLDKSGAIDKKYWNDSKKFQFIEGIRVRWESVEAHEMSFENEQLFGLDIDSASIFSDDILNPKNLPQDFTGPFGITVNRKDLIKILEDMAVSLGIGVFRGVQVTKIIENEDRPVKLLYNRGSRHDKEISFLHLISATGISSFTSKSYLQSFKVQNEFLISRMSAYYSCKPEVFEEQRIPTTCRTIEVGRMWTISLTPIPYYSGKINKKIPSDHIIYQISLSTPSSTLNDTRKYSSDFKEVFVDAIRRTIGMRQILDKSTIVGDSFVIEDQINGYSSSILAERGINLVGSEVGFLVDSFGHDNDLSLYSSFVSAVCVSSLVKGESRELDIIPFYDTSMRLLLSRAFFLQYLLFEHVLVPFEEMEKLLQNSANSIISFSRTHDQESAATSLIDILSLANVSEEEDKINRIKSIPQLIIEGMVFDSEHASSTHMYIDFEIEDDRIVDDDKVNEIVFHPRIRHLSIPRIQSSASVVIIGGGVAGSLTAISLALQGVPEVVLMEKDIFPRYHSGFSINPFSVACLNFLGLKEKLEKCNFTPQNGISLNWNEDSYSLNYADFVHQILPSPMKNESKSGWNVDRAVFDKTLANYAQSLGVKIFYGVSATKPVRYEDTEIDLNLQESEKTDESRVFGVQWKGNDGSKGEISCNWVVDATGFDNTSYYDEESFEVGNDGFSLSGSKIRHKSLDTVTIWSHWIKSEFTNESRIIIELDGGGYMTLESITSMSQDYDCVASVILPRWRYFSLINAGGYNEEIYHNSLKETGIMDTILNSANLTYEIQTSFDSSFIAETVCGPGYLVIGDSASFVSSIFNSNILSTAYEALVAGTIIGQVVGGTLLEKTGLDFYQKSVESFHNRALFSTLSMFSSSKQFGELYTPSLYAVGESIIQESDNVKAFISHQNMVDLICMNKEEMKFEEIMITTFDLLVDCFPTSSYNSISNMYINLEEGKIRFVSLNLNAEKQLKAVTRARRKLLAETESRHSSSGGSNSLTRSHGSKATITTKNRGSMSSLNKILNSSASIESNINKLDQYEDDVMGGSLIRSESHTSNLSKVSFNISKSATVSSFASIDIDDNLSNLIATPIVKSSFSKADLISYSSSDRHILEFEPSGVPISKTDFDKIETLSNLPSGDTQVIDKNEINKSSHDHETFDFNDDDEHDYIVKSDSIVQFNIDESSDEDDIGDLVADNIVISSSEDEKDIEPEDNDSSELLSHYVNSRLARSHSFRMDTLRKLKLDLADSLKSNIVVPETSSKPVRTTVVKPKRRHRRNDSAAFDDPLSRFLPRQTSFATNNSQKSTSTISKISNYSKGSSVTYDNNIYDETETF